MAGLLSRSQSPPAESAVEEYLNEVRRVRAMPRSMKPQLPHSDYVRFAATIAGEMNMLPSQSLRKRHRVFMPALLAISKRHMSSESDSVSEGDKTGGESVMREMNEMIEKYKKGLGIALHIFQSLQGRWTFERSLVSELDSSPSGTVRGHVEFTALLPSASSTFVSNSSSASGISKVFPDLLYEENGKFDTNKGFSFDVSRRYIYTYNSTKDSLDIYFAKAATSTPVSITASSNAPSSSNNSLESVKNGLTNMTLESSVCALPAYERDYLFVSLSFAATPDGWLGTACHPCGQDLYNSRFLFALRGVFLDSMRMEYTVKGPHKDYLSVTTLKR